MQNVVIVARSPAISPDHSSPALPSHDSAAVASLLSTRHRRPCGAWPTLVPWLSGILFLHDFRCTLLFVSVLLQIKESAPDPVSGAQQGGSANATAKAPAAGGNGKGTGYEICAFYFATVREGVFGVVLQVYIFFW